MKDKIFLIGSILAILSGAFLAIFMLNVQDDNMPAIVAGFVVVFLGFIALVTGYTTPSVSQSKEGTIIGYLMVVSSILMVISAFDFQALWILGVIGAALIALGVVCMWPCFCCQGSQKNKDKVIGVASAHDSITLHEISQRTGLSHDVVKDTIYDALGKGELIGKMEGPTFIRGRPTTTTTDTTTREREVVRVLVICPYCGSKTEQGLSKCQNCQAAI